MKDLIRARALLTDEDESGEDVDESIDPEKLTGEEDEENIGIDMDNWEN